MSKRLIRSTAVVALTSTALIVSACTDYPESPETARATVVSPSSDTPVPEYHSVYVPLPEGGAVLCVERTVKDSPTASPAISCDWSRLRQ